ncbi:MAG: hypothetical protein ACYTHK_00235 [Planctomycetota bacterium]
MRWIAVATFVVGLALGYLLGANGESSPARVERLPARDSAKLESGRGEEEPARPDSPDSEVPESRPATIETRTAAAGEISAGKGRLVVVVGEAGNWSIELAGTDMRGEPMSEQLEEVSDGRYRIEAYAGWYTLEWWADEKTNRIGVEIRTGEVTHVELRGRTHDHLPPPVPAGFGRLTVRLIGISGEPLPNVDFHVVGQGISEEDVEEVQTQSDGAESILLRPGRYEVRAGAETRAVTLREREETVCRIDHARTGEVHMPERFPGTIKLRRPAGVDEEARYFAESNAGGVRHLVFVEPGAYEYGILVSGQRGHAWGKGKVQVPAGRAVTVAPALPTGSITIEAALDPTPAVRKRGGVNAYVMRGDFGKRTVVTVGLTPDKSRPGIYRGTAAHIPPGTWMISSSPRGYVRVGRSVTVADSAVTVRVRFERKP